MREAKCDLCNWFLSIDCINKKEICENFEPVDPVEEEQMEKTIIKQMEEIAKDICDNYCKYPDEYRANNEDLDISYNKMIREKCDRCPLNQII